MRLELKIEGNISSFDEEDLDLVVELDDENFVEPIRAYLPIRDLAVALAKHLDSETATHIDRRMKK